jgi:hypothetical protein
MPVDPFLGQVRGAARPGDRRRARDVVHRDPGPTCLLVIERRVQRVEEARGRAGFPVRGPDQGAVAGDADGQAAERVGGGVESLAELRLHAGHRLVVGGPEAGGLEHAPGDTRRDRGEDTGADEPPDQWAHTSDLMAGAPLFAIGPAYNQGW